MNPSRKLLQVAVALVVATAGFASRAHAQATPATKPTAAPYTLEKLAEVKNLKPAAADVKSAADLKAIEDRVEAIARNALPAIVNIQIRIVAADGTIQGEQGSGVIVSKDGYILTAGHVSGEPKQPVTLVLSNGTTVSGITLGANSLYDSGMIKITSRTNADFPFMPMGSVSKMKAGDWVVAMGHPGGLQKGRAPVVRLGKVLSIVDQRARSRNGEWFIQTDCPLIMGDSGGPVFDLDGRVVGINSKIGISTTSNIHVPIDTFEDTWDRLASSEKWGKSSVLVASALPPNMLSPNALPPAASLSATVREDTAGTGIVILSVRPDKAADKAHIEAGDVIAKIDGRIVKTFDDLKNLMSAHKPGDTVTMDLLVPNGGITAQNAKTKQVRVTLDAAER